MKIYRSWEFRKIQTPHPYGDPDRQYYRHKEKKFTLVFLDMTTGFEKEKGIPHNYVAHVCSRDGEPDHDEIIIVDPHKMAKYE
tara:strand:- start:358 stop:606 length:249 start_codon:yes stop_codon:yes gene_type:complete